MKNTMFDHEAGKIVMFTENGRGYVAIINVETILPVGLTDEETFKYLLEDFESDM
jgi:hypothetical protein